MSIYIKEKQIFSSLQSKFHKLLNILKSDKTINTNSNTNSDKIYKLKQINDLIEVLESKIIDYNENNYYLTNNEKENIDKNNKVISNLLPLYIFYRTLLD